MRQTTQGASTHLKIKVSQSSDANRTSSKVRTSTPFCPYHWYNLIHTVFHRSGLQNCVYTGDGNRTICEQTGFADWSVFRRVQIFIITFQAIIQSKFSVTFYFIFVSFVSTHRKKIKTTCGVVPARAACLRPPDYKTHKATVEN